MNYEQLIETATTKNFNIEFSQDKFGNVLVGISKGKGCYHWFDVFGGQVMFNHTYSCNTGRVKKGVMHGIRVIMSLEN